MKKLIALLLAAAVVAPALDLAAAPSGRSSARSATGVKTSSARAGTMGRARGAPGGPAPAPAAAYAPAAAPAVAAPAGGYDDSDIRKQLEAANKEIAELRQEIKALKIAGGVGEWPSLEHFIEESTLVVNNLRRDVDSLKAEIGAGSENGLMFKISTLMQRYAELDTWRATLNNDLRANALLMEQKGKEEAQREDLQREQLIGLKNELVESKRRQAELEMQMKNMR